MEIDFITDQCEPRGNGMGNGNTYMSRVVHTRDGVFTALLLPGGKTGDKRWQLAWRREDRWVRDPAWQGGSFVEPPNVLAGRDGTIYVIAWPAGRLTIWSGKPENGTLTLKHGPVTGMPPNNWPYCVAGIDAEDNIVITSSDNELAPSGYHFARRDGNTGRWTVHRMELDTRHCNGFVFPKGAGMTLVGVVDVLWEVLGYRKPEGCRHDYIWGSWVLWRTEALAESAPREIAARRVAQRDGEFCQCMAQDALIDSRGVTHIVYGVWDTTTGGNPEFRHVAVTSQGKQLYDVDLPTHTVEDHCWTGYRMFEDQWQRLWLIHRDGLLYRVGPDGNTAGGPEKLDLDGKVMWFGWAVAAPRGGTPPSDGVDVIFPARSDSVPWYHARIRVPEPSH